jgi:hypothetical protein
MYGACRATPGSCLPEIVDYHTARCESTVLAYLLNQLPHVYWDGEIYYSRSIMHMVVADYSNQGYWKTISVEIHLKN